MKLTRLRITNYRGIAARDETIGPNGAVVKGKNGGGKTSVLHAIRAALAAQDIGPDAIRNGTDKAEIIIDLGDVSVRRAITARSSSVKITSANGDTKAAPQTWLTELLGTSPLDPLDLFLAPPKERRARVLAALPVRVTAEQLEAWGVESTADLSRHGLEVVAELRDRYYAERTAANADAKRMAEDARRAHEAASTLGAPADAPADALSLEEAKAADDAALAALRELEARAEAREAAEARAGATRARVERLRADAGALQASAPPAPDEAERDAAVSIAAKTLEEVKRLEELLVAERQKLTSAQARCNALTHRAAISSATLRDVDAMLAQAAELEAAIAETLPPVVTEADLSQAADDAAVAREELEAAESRAGLERMQKSAALTDQVAAAAAAAARAAADRLDVLVRRLTDDAPRELLAGTDGIRGLSLAGGELALDGVRLDGLSGAEQMRLAVEIARRANVKSKILIVDGLERLDPEQLPAFIAAATTDDWQLIATRVDAGEVVFEAVCP